MQAARTLALTLQPADAEIWSTGIRGSTTPLSDRLTIDLSAGRHNIQIHKPGFVGYLTDVRSVAANRRWMCN
jgi:hypothetical protein